MKRILTVLLSGILSFAFAQNNQTITNYTMNKQECYNDNYHSANPIPYEQTHSYLKNKVTQQQGNSGNSRSVKTVEVGSAGNLFTILLGEVNRIATINSLNTVVFIHRTDPTFFPSDNVGQYRYDVSYDGGATWSLNHGVLNPKGNQLSLAGRYPNVTMYNPPNNTIADSAYLAYFGTWLPFTANGEWDGHFTGVAKLNNNPQTFTETVSTPYSGDIEIARGLSNGAPGVFWAVNWIWDGISSPVNYPGFLIFRGLWNSSTKDVDWALKDTIFPPYDLSFDNTSQITGLNMAFDPTGQYGWICMTGDILTGGPNTMQPVFYSTNDGGDTWSNAIAVDLSTMENVINGLSQNNPQLSGIPTTAFDTDIVVDINGNPHMVVVVGHSGTDYAISSGSAAEMKIYDITRDPNASSGCQWKAILLDSIATLRGTFGVDVSEDNRPQASLSPDGKKVFFGWLDSDPAVTGGENTLPDLKTRAIDVTTGLATPVVNRTGDDLIWFGAALFASFSPTTLASSGTYTIPTIFAQLNPNSENEEDPASFHYAQDIQYSDADFATDIWPPQISLNGNSPMTIVAGNAYSEPGATGTDNQDNFVNVIIDASNVNTAQVGNYMVTYNATDSSGNQSCEIVRMVNVVASPDQTAPIISLIGNSTITIDVCDFFTDPGATAADNVDGNITSNIVKTSTVPNPITTGSYTITYNVTDGAGNSAVPVVRNVEITNLPPTITLFGGDTIMLEQCNQFIEPGAIAYDNCLGSVPWITGGGGVDSSIAGTYFITYQADDGINPPAVATRTVIVTPDATPPNISLLGGNPLYHYLGTSYTDPGAVAVDCVSGNVSGNITSNASTAVDTNTRGSYTVTYMVSDNAGNAATPITRTVIVGTEPSANFDFTFTDCNLIKFNDISQYNPDTWSWDFGDQGGNNQPNPNHIYQSNGIYTVCLSVENDFNRSLSIPRDTVCKDVAIACVGLDEISLGQTLEVYPNPTTGIVNIDINGDLKELVISVHNIIGEELKTVEFTKIPANRKFSLDLSDYANGIYMIKINTNKGRVTKKITLHTGK